MRKFLLSFFAVAALALAPIAAQAQVAQGNPVYWNASRQDVAQLVATTATSATTLTITPPSGQSVYVTEIRVTNCAGASAVTAAGVTSVTSTNLGGYAYTVGSGVTAGLCAQDTADTFSGAGMKSAIPGTAVTVITPTFATNQTVRVSVYYYFAY